MKKLVVLLLTLLLVLMAAVPAAAAPPVIEKGEGERTWYFEELSDACGFPVYDHAVASWQITTFFDNAGNATGFKYHENGTDELFSPRSPGMKLIGNFAVNYMVDFVTGSWSAPGTSFSITVPGYGIVFKNAGLWKYPHPRGLVGIHTPWNPATNYVDPDAAKVICSLLSGE